MEEGEGEAGDNPAGGDEDPDKVDAPEEEENVVEEEK